MDPLLRLFQLLLTLKSPSILRLPPIAKFILAYLARGIIYLVQNAKIFRIDFFIVSNFACWAAS